MIMIESEFFVMDANWAASKTSMKGVCFRVHVWNPRGSAKPPRTKAPHCGVRQGRAAKVAAISQVDSRHVFKYSCVLCTIILRFFSRESNCERFTKQMSQRKQKLDGKSPNWMEVWMRQFADFPMLWLITGGYQSYLFHIYCIQIILQ
jgi:hypothetical protein